MKESYKAVMFYATSLFVGMLIGFFFIWMLNKQTEQQTIHSIRMKLLEDRVDRLDIELSKRKGKQ